MKDKSRHTPLPAADILPLPDSLKRDVRTALVAKYGPRMGDTEFELLWQLLVSATWEYRQTAPVNTLDVQATVDQATHLQHQLAENLGMHRDLFDDLAQIMIRCNSCAGFFGLYYDRFMLTSPSSKSPIATQNNTNKNCQRKGSPNVVELYLCAAFPQQMN